MNSLDLIRMGLRNLLRRKTRTILTVLGVVIGTAAIVVMLSLGIGMNESFNREMQKMGSLNIINVNNYRMPEGDSGIMQGPIQTGVLDDKAVAKMAQLEGVEAVTPLFEAYPKFVSGKYVAFGQLIGIDTRVMKEFEFKIDQGSLLQAGESNTVVFGCNMAQNFYNPKSRGGFNMYMGMPGQKPPVDVMNDKMLLTFDMSYGERQPMGAVQDQTVKKPAKLYKIKVAGLLAQSNDEKDYCAYMDINQLKKLVKEFEKSQGNQGGRGISQSQQGYQRVMVKVSDIEDVEMVQNKIKQMGYGTYSLSDIRKSMQKQANTIQMVLGGIGAISLLIAALGITNTMIMSIYERTREIGVMKVLGCMLGDVRRLFLFEAGMIGFIGGLVGIVFSYGASSLLNYVGSGFMNRGGPPMGGNPEPNHISVIPVWLALTSIVFAVIIGLVSGFYPARRAMKLSALEAIRTE
ncbi:MAG: ABC transporter permease [Clostridia bacterium]|nr:ABC transporter permease [Clostridia bacterium]